MSTLPASSSTHPSPITRVPGPRDLAGFHRDVLQLMKAHPAVFIALPVLMYLPFDMILSLATHGVADNLDSLRVALRGERLIGAAVGTLTASTTLQAVRMVGAGQTPTMLSALSAGLQTWGKVFIASITTGFLITLSFICFIFPGFFVVSRYAIVLPAVVDGLSGQDARAHSSNLIKEHGTFTVWWWLIALGGSWYALSLLANVCLAFVTGLAEPPLMVSLITDSIGSAAINVVAAGITVFSAVLYGELSGKSELSPVGLELIDSGGHHLAAPRSTGARGLALVAGAGALAVLVSLPALALGLWMLFDSAAATAFIEQQPALMRLLELVANE